MVPHMVHLQDVVKLHTFVLGHLGALLLACFGFHLRFTLVAFDLVSDSIWCEGVGVGVGAKGGSTWAGGDSLRGALGWERRAILGKTNKARSHTHTQAQATQPLHRGPPTPIPTAIQHDGGAMDHGPPPPPPPSQPPPVSVAVMAGATAAASGAEEAVVALPAAFPSPNGGGAHPPSDSGGGEEWGGTAPGGAAVNAAAASARARRRLGPFHIARDGRCGRRRGHPHARAGGWVGLVASSARRPIAPRLC